MKDSEELSRKVREGAEGRFRRTEFEGVFWQEGEHRPDKISFQAAFVESRNPGYSVLDVRLPDEWEGQVRFLPLR